MSRVDDIRARAEAATQGPWAIWHDLDHRGFTTVGDAESYDEILANGECEESNPTAHVYVEEDAEFIAHAREDVPWLLEHVDRLLEERAEAWERGFKAGFNYSETGQKRRNPYLKADR